MGIEMKGESQTETNARKRLWKLSEKAGGAETGESSLHGLTFKAENRKMIKC